MIRMRIWVMMVIMIMVMAVFIVIVPVIMTVVMIHIKPASPGTKTFAELTILNITSWG